MPAPAGAGNTNASAASRIPRPEIRRPRRGAPVRRASGRPDSKGAPVSGWSAASSRRPARSRSRTSSVMVYTRTDADFWPEPPGPAQNQVVSTRPATGFEARLLDQQGAVWQAVRRDRFAGEPCGEDVAVHGVDRHLAPGPHRGSERAEDRGVIGLLTVTERAEQAERGVEARLADRCPEVVPHVAQSLGREIAPPALGLREQVSGLVHAEDARAHPRQREAHPSVAAAGVEHAGTLAHPEDPPERPGLLVAPLGHGAPDADVLVVEELLPPRSAGHGPAARRISPAARAAACAGAGASPERTCRASRRSRPPR